MKRYFDDPIIDALKTKAIILAGARQAGKTTLSRQLMAQSANAVYLNYDVAQDRAIIEAQSWPHSTTLLVLDELHKMHKWKAWLKGIIDGRPLHQHILITGSARLDFLKQGGDALSGRVYTYHLHPLSVAEDVQFNGRSPQDSLTRLMERGGFPEPFLIDSVVDARRWRLQYVDGLVRDDILDFSRLHEVNTMRVLIDALRLQVGSPLSVASLARDLGASASTIARYIEILESLFIVFTVHPWHKNISRALLKAPKLYFLDSGLIRDEAARFENTVACALLKATQYQYDVEGRVIGLHYIRTKDGAEVDFALSEEGDLTELIECKLSDSSLHPALVRFHLEHNKLKASQVVCYANNDQERNGLHIKKASRWLAALPA